ncbi:MMPL family transporter [Microcella daejeonensis]|uniref:MMPL family transporter n=1 Tax=Microcella daejeonensis TaxID=2994971 RepID=A0A9E8S8Z8_9MICO|nr:MMPL family transporter [Microcella daejeonensis]WAB81818.1 MMPL family transporter [Microcella daejeonensis]
MATLLYRLGRASYRRAWIVITAWALVVAGVLGGGLALGGQFDETFTIPGTESQDALDTLDALFPEVSGASAQAVVVAPEGERVDDPAVRDEIDLLIDRVSDVGQVTNVLGPFDEFAGDQVSDDGTVAIVQVQLDGAATDITEESLAALTASGDGLDSRVEFAGQVFQDTTVGITPIEVLGVLFAGVVLVITFGSLRAAGMPLVSALVGVAIVMGAIIALTAVTPVSSSAPLLALMIGLAVGIDYALFILSRHRGQLARGEDPEESAAIAVGTAGSAVVFAGVTVIIALLGLLVVGIPFLSVMGVGAAVAVFIAIAAAVTLVPAMLGLAGAKLAPKEGSRAWKRAHPVASTRPTMGRRWVRGVMTRPIVTTVAVVAVLGTLSIPTFSLDLNLPDGGSEPAGSTQREAYDLIADAFGPGTAGPLLVTLDITQTVDVLEDLEAIRGELEQVEGVASVGQGIPSPGLETAILQVAPEFAPDAPETKQVVADIRAIADEIEDEYGTPLAVTGVTAVGIDISTRLTNALVPFALIVVGLSIVLLMAVFRSVLVPVKAALGFLLSVGTGMGVTVAVFQWGWGAELLHAEPGPILSFMPIILMAVLFGLAMDYEVFLVSGMREEFVRTGDPQRSIEDGFANGARVVTAAALIMVFVFAAFVPEGAGVIKPIALGLAVGIAVDAFVVRMTLGPALMTLFGRAGWWFPRSLDRALPDLDIEGEKLRHHREHVVWASGRQGVIVAEGLALEGVDAALDLHADAGARVHLAGPSALRRLAAATLAGHVEPAAGRALVAGAVLPSEAGRVARRVALVDVGGDRIAPAVTVGALVSERLALAAGRPRRARLTRDWLAELDAALRGLGEESAAARRALRAPSTPVAALDGRTRALLLAAVATIDRTPVIVLDHRDDALDAASSELVDALVVALAPRGTVRIWGRPEGEAAPRGAVVARLMPRRSDEAEASATEDSSTEASTAATGATPAATTAAGSRPEPVAPGTLPHSDRLASAAAPTAKDARS